MRTIKVANSTTTVYYSVTDVAPSDKPYLRISDQYLPLTTASLAGIKLRVKTGNTTYRACTYQSGYYNTSSNVPGSMSSTTALTRVSTSGYETRVSTSGYETRVSTSGYETRISTSSYETRVSTSGYETRSSISGYATRESVSGYATRISTSAYGTRVSTSGYETRVSTSGYATRVSTSGYQTRVSTSGYATRVSTSGYATSVSTGQTESTTLKIFTYDGIPFYTQSNRSSQNDRYGVCRIANWAQYRAVARHMTTATHPTYGTQERGNIWIGDYGPNFVSQTEASADIRHLTDVTALTKSHDIMGASRAVVSMPSGPKMHAGGYMVSGQMGYTSYVTLTNGQTLSSTTWIGQTADTETRHLTQVMGRGWTNTNSTYTFNVTSWKSYSTSHIYVLTESAYIPPDQSWGYNVYKTSSVYIGSESTYTYTRTYTDEPYHTYTHTGYYYPYLNTTYTALDYTATTSGLFSTVESTVTWITDANSNTKTEKATVSRGWHVSVSFGDVGLSQGTTISQTSAVTTATLTRASTSQTLTCASTSATLTRASTSASLTRASTSATLTRASTSIAYTRVSTSATLTRASTSQTLTRASTSATLTRASTSATLTCASTSATLTRASTSATLTRASTSASLTRVSTSGYSGKLSSSTWA